MCWVMPPASPATTLVERMRSSSRVLPWSTWPMTVTTGGPRPQVGVVLLVLLLEVPGQQLGLLLLAGVDQAHVGAELGGEQLDHVVGERLGGRDHLALQEQEAHDVAGAAVELGPEVACRRAALDDDLALGHRGGRGLVRGQLRRLELLEVAPATARPALGRPTARHAAAAALGRCTGRVRPRRSGRRSHHPPDAPPKPPPLDGPPPGRPGPERASAGARRIGTTRPRARRGGVGPAPAHARRRRDRPAARTERRAGARWRRDGLARRAEGRAGCRAGGAGGGRGVGRRARRVPGRAGSARSRVGPGLQAAGGRSSRGRRGRCRGRAAADQARRPCGRRADRAGADGGAAAGAAATLRRRGRLGRAPPSGRSSSRRT